MSYRPIFPKIYYGWIYALSLVVIPVKSRYSLLNYEGIILREITDYKKLQITLFSLFFKYLKYWARFFCNKCVIEQTFWTFTDFANKIICIFEYRFETSRFGQPLLVMVSIFRSSKAFSKISYSGSVLWKPKIYKIKLHKKLTYLFYNQIWHEIKFKHQLCLLQSFFSWMCTDRQKFCKIFSQIERVLFVEKKYFHLFSMIRDSVYHFFLN